MVNLQDCWGKREWQYIEVSGVPSGTEWGIRDRWVREELFGAHWGRKNRSEVGKKETYRQGKKKKKNTGE